MTPESAFMASFIVNVVLILILYIVHMWNPYAFRIAWAKRLVWIIKQDMDVEPVSAYDEGGAYVTKDHGRFEFDRKDVTHYGKKPSIFALEWMTRAVRPDCIQGLEYLKKNKLKRYDQLVAVLDADVITWQEYLDKYPDEKPKFIQMFGDIEMPDKQLEVEESTSTEIHEYEDHDLPMDDTVEVTETEDALPDNQTDTDKELIE